MSEPAWVQAEGLDVHETEDGLVVYQAATDRVHYLNHTAAAVFTLATSPVTVADAARHLAELWGLSDPPTTEVDACAAQLRDEGVLVSATS